MDAIGAPDEFMSLPAVARCLGVEAKTLRRHLDEVPHFRLGGRTYFRRSNLETWIRQQEAAGDGGR